MPALCALHVHSPHCSAPLRESRPEDLERIAKLTGLVKAKHDEAERAKEELRYFRLELQNRETNFNKVFNRQPTVAQPPTTPRGKPGAAGAGGTGGRAAGVTTTTTTSTERPASTAAGGGGGRGADRPVPSRSSNASVSASTTAGGGMTPRSGSANSAPRSASSRGGGI